MATWEQWEGRVIDGRFPVRQYLGGSEQGATYLTEINGSKAAIKLVPSDARYADAKLSWWQFARGLSHPHLIRILDAGHWHADDEQDMLFVIMEYADENLAEVLSSRRLTPVEASEMLVPTLDALDFLHGQGMVVGNIKPANIMAINDKLKLASDAIRPVSTSEESAGSGSAYAAPEQAEGKISPSGDIWSLGMTLVEALTNRLPTWDGTDENYPRLPENIPAPFDDTTKHCLSRDPGRRWSTTEIREHLARPPVAAKAGVPKQGISAVAEGHDSPAPVAPGTVPSTPARETRIERQGTTWNPTGVRVTAAVIIIFVVIAAGFGLLHHRSEPVQPASTSFTQPSAATPAQPAAAVPTQPVKTGNVRASKTNASHASDGAVTHEVLPDVTAQARNTINGTVTVKLKVTVDASGAVSHTTLASRGPSQYFADQALQAARKWTFTAPTVDGKAVPSEWSLKFEFKRNGTKVQPQRTSPS